MIALLSNTAFGIQRRARSTLCKALLGLALTVGVLAPTSANVELALQGQAAFDQGDMAKAARLFEQSAASLLSTVGERHVDSMTVLSSLAVTYMHLGRLQEAHTLGERVLRLRTQVLGGRHPDTLTSQMNLGQNLIEMGRGQEAAAILGNAMVLMQQTLGASDPRSLMAMSNMATALNSIGRHDQALQLNEAVLKARKARLGDNDPDTLLSMNNVAATLGLMGRHSEELAMIEQVVAGRVKISGQDAPETLVAMSNQSITLSRLGRHAESLAIKKKVLETRIRTLGPRHPRTLQSWNNAVFSLNELGKFDEAYKINEQLVVVATEVLGERHPLVMAALSSRANLLGRLGRHEEQLAVHESVLKIRQQVDGERHPSTLLSMNNVATTQLKLGRAADAQATLQKAMPVVTSTLGVRNSQSLLMMQNLAWVYIVSGQPDQAARLSADYVEGAEWMRSQPGLSVENRQSAFGSFARGYRLFSMAHGLQGQAIEGFRLSELSKARTLLEGMTAQRAGRSGVLPKDEQAKLDELNRRADALGLQIAQARSPDARQALDTERNQLARAHEALQSRLKSQFPKYAKLSETRLLGAEQLPGLVPAGTMAISFVASQDERAEVAAWLLDAAGQPRFVHLGSLPALNEAVDIVRRGQSDDRPLKEILGEEGRRAWRLADGSYRLLDATQPAPKDASEVADAREVAQYLSAKLLQPLAKELQGKPRWIISPDGPLAQLTFETLPFGDKAEPAIASAEIHYTQSLSVYALSRNLQKQYEGLKDRQSLFAMGNPEYSQRSLNPRERRGLKRNINVRGAQQLQEMDALWQDLPGTEAEVKAVARLFPGSASTYLGPQATEQQLQALNDKGQLKNYRYLLMSAHGYLAPEQPALSSIVLGLRNRTPEADGYVTASEWPGYDLRSDLMVLSACDSGVGKVVSGEGVMGLPFALFVAGNVNTILSLWPVDDEGTAAFVTSLFGKLKAGQGASQALANTKREFLRHKEFSHPSYWAPFILVGAG